MSAWFCARKLSFAVALAIALAGTYWPVAVQAQQPSEQAPPQQRPQSQQPPQPPPEQQPAQQQPALTQQQVQQLVAPIALYPDALLAQVLTASTYPLEVRWRHVGREKSEPQGLGARRARCRSSRGIQASKGLTSVPQVLAMMNEKLDWTNQLGEAFLAQPDDVQNAIQALRKQAEDDRQSEVEQGAEGQAGRLRRQAGLCRAARVHRDRAGGARLHLCSGL